MLPKKHRLSAYQMSAVQRSGMRLSEQGVHCSYKHSVATLSRFGFVVPVRVDKRAAGRNRIRRVLREAVAQVLPALGRPVDMVLSVKHAPKVITTEAMVSVVKILFQKAGIL